MDALILIPMLKIYIFLFSGRMDGLTDTQMDGDINLAGAGYRWDKLLAQAITSYCGRRV